MRYQERIYIQNDNRAVRNRDLLNVNMSSDICIFTSPTFSLSGGTKIPCQSSLVVDVLPFNFNTAFLIAKENCATSSICHSATTWVTRLYADSILINENQFFNTPIYFNLPTSDLLVNSVQINLQNAGYEYEKNGDDFIVYKPYGVDEIKIDVCISIYTQTGCSVCNIYCRNAYTGNFETLNNNSDGVYVLNTGTSIPFTFTFTGNTNTFIENNVNFKYSVYKYLPNSQVFKLPEVYKSDVIPYTTFSSTSALTVSIPTSLLNLDGEYIIKGYFETSACTDFLSRLGRIIDTSIYKTGNLYGLYVPETDHYFLAIKEAEKPVFNGSSSDETTYSPITLYQQVIYVDFTQEGNVPENNDDFTESFLYERTGSTFVLSSEYIGDVMVTLNGLTMAKDIDYTLSGQVLTFLGPISNNDVINLFYTRTTTSTLISNTILINSTIPSGATNSQGTSKYFYNTTTGKYEIYTNNEPLANSRIIVMLNGITLIDEIDYYQSTSNPNRIILNGILMVGDILNVIYYPKAVVIDGITQTNTYIGWNIETPPALQNGEFSLEYSLTPNFSGYTVSAVVPYEINVTDYIGLLTLTGSAGTKLYYRVKNTKNYESICGDIIQSINYSETVPVVIQSNAINSY